jgi:hypothetical protein
VSPSRSGSKLNSLELRSTSAQYSSPGRRQRSETRLPTIPGRLGSPAVDYYEVRSTTAKEGDS